MSEFELLYEQINMALGVDGLQLPVAGVKFFTVDEELPAAVLEYHPTEISVTSCQALRQALLGDPVLLTVKNIGCIAAAISLGLVDENQEEPFEGPRVYTEIMRDQSRSGDRFQPPSPKQFTDGTVYACRAAKRGDFCLFGSDDSGRFREPETARRAIREMMAIQPPTTRGVFLYPPDFDIRGMSPDVVVFSVRPVELARIVQAYGYNTGERITGTMGTVRVVNSDLIVRPYLTGKPNVSTYCVGARLIAKYEAERLGIGMPYEEFCRMAEGMVDSTTGFPFHLYPGAAE